MEYKLKRHEQFRVPVVWSSMERQMLRQLDDALTDLENTCAALYERVTELERRLAARGETDAQA